MIRGMQEPQRLTSFRTTLPVDVALQGGALEARISQLQGVAEVSLLEPERFIYLKINKKEFDENELQALLTRGH